jgi:chromosome segregation ATPase
MEKIKNFFSWGNFILTLKETLDEIKKELMINKDEFNKLNKQDIHLLSAMNFFKEQLKSLDNRLNVIEQSLMELNIKKGTTKNDKIKSKLLDTTKNFYIEPQDE